MRFSVLAAAAAISLSACGGGDEKQQAPVGEAPGGGAATPAVAAPEPELSLEEQGRIAFRVCAVCHAVTDPTAPDYRKLIGPSLYVVYGASSAHQEGFAYSAAMMSADITWDDANLDAYIHNPQKFMPGNMMSFPGEPRAEKREAIIAYLKTLK
ncbi:MAG: c-type cytochrome [Parvularculaceae bacterium]|nr:c-type cytochrome [Parvularculaceae bacterium]